MIHASWYCGRVSGGLMGPLARAFFYAGGRALLVSDWSIDSEVATPLTTSTFAVMKADPKLSRAGALRNVMLAYMNDEGSPLTRPQHDGGHFPSSERGPRRSGGTTGA
jgi:CHAT domain